MQINEEAVTEEIPTRGSKIAIKKGMSTKELEAWFKSEERALNELKRVGKRTKIAKKAVEKEIRMNQRIVKILNEDDAMYVKDKIEKKVYKIKKLEQRLNKHIKKLIEHFRILNDHFILNYHIKERIKKVIETLKFYYLLFREFWEGGLGFEKELKEWKTDSLDSLRKTFRIYLNNLIDLLGMLHKLDKLEEAITEVEKRHYQEAKRTSKEKKKYQPAA